MKRRAFTLVEVLVSLAILALAAVALGGAYLNLIVAEDKIRRRDAAQDDLHWARVALLGEPERAKVEQGGDVILPDGRTARWRATITATEVSDLFDVALEMDAPPPDNAGGDLVQASQLLRLLRPTWSTEAEREQKRAAAKQRLDSQRAKDR
jgi:general secretion pathway protein I